MQRVWPPKLCLTQPAVRGTLRLFYGGEGSGYGLHQHGPSLHALLAGEMRWVVQRSNTTMGEPEMEVTSGTALYVGNVSPTHRATTAFTRRVAFTRPRGARQGWRCAHAHACPNSNPSPGSHGNACTNSNTRVSHYEPHGDASTRPQYEPHADAAADPTANVWRRQGTLDC